MECSSASPGLGFHGDEKTQIKDWKFYLRGAKQRKNVSENPSFVPCHRGLGRETWIKSNDEKILAED